MPLDFNYTPSNGAHLRGKTLFITGASRGIGRAIALRAALDGANIAIIAKTTEPHPKLRGTIFTVAEEVEKLGGRAFPIACDIRDEAQVESAIRQTVEKFGGIDIVINNASAINLSGTLETTMKRYDLMHDINVRGTFAVSRAALPYLLSASNPHILNLSPPLEMESKWFGPYPAYTMSKYGMSMVALGLSEEFKEQGVAVNAIWPKTVISTSALQAFAGDKLDELHEKSRTVGIMADSAYAILCQPSKFFTGVFAVDEAVMEAQNVKNLSIYSCDARTDRTDEHSLDLFVKEEKENKVPQMKIVLARPSKL